MQDGGELDSDDPLEGVYRKDPRVRFNVFFFLADELKLGGGGGS
jgi:hypothetical protein